MGFSEETLAETAVITPDKAFNKGCMWGMSGGKSEKCPYLPESNLATHWQQGWLTGYNAFSKKQAQ